MLPSWKMGTPGWCMHDSPSLELPFLYLLSQPRLLQIAPSGISKVKSSSSDSGAGGGCAGICCAGCIGARVAAVVFRSSIFLASIASSSCVFSSSCGGLSVVECTPVVHGSISRNSSKLRTRGLQHFHPCHMSKQSFDKLQILPANASCTFLALMENWRPWMIMAVLVGICELFATPLVNTFLDHCRSRFG